MKINIYNYQTNLKVSKISIQKQVTALLYNEKIICDEISIYLVDEKTIINLHKQHFDDPTPTDCISFPIDHPNIKQAHCFLGEIFVCTDTALKYGKENNENPYDEVTLYIIHGILHLIGYNDILEKDRTIMRKKEKSCMNLIKAKKLGICSKHTKQLMGQK